MMFLYNIARVQGGSLAAKNLAYAIVMCADAFRVVIRHDGARMWLSGMGPWASNIQMREGLTFILSVMGFAVSCGPRS